MREMLETETGMSGDAQAAAGLLGTFVLQGEVRNGTSEVHRLLPAQPEGGRHFTSKQSMVRTTAAPLVVLVIGRGVTITRRRIGEAEIG